MGKKKIYSYLEELNIWHEITEHEAVYDMSELNNVPLPYPENIAKNIFVRDDKKRSFYLITIKGDKRIDLKELKRKYNTRPLSFASEKYLMDILGLTPGSVSPFGILNDKNSIVKFLLDKDFLDLPGPIGIHPNDNTATVWLKPDDLIALITKNGNEVEIIEV